jgi:hypothetical protein
MFGAKTFAYVAGPWVLTVSLDDEHASITARDLFDFLGTVRFTAVWPAVVCEAANLDDDLTQGESHRRLRQQFVKTLQRAQALLAETTVLQTTLEAGTRVVPDGSATGARTDPLLDGETSLASTDGPRKNHSACLAAEK